jgi:hypothetical protein
MCQQLQHIATAMRSYTTGFDATLLTCADAATAVKHAATIEHMAATIKALAAARAAEAKNWKRGGHRSAEEELAHMTGTTVAGARDALTLGRNLAAQPEVNAAARRGELSPTQASAITDAVTADPGSARRLVDAARAGGSLAHLKDQCAAIKAAATDLEARRREIHRRRGLRAWTDPGGTWHIAGQGNPEHGAQIMAAIASRADQAFRHARLDGEHEHLDAYRFDGLVQIALDATSPRQDNADGDPTNGSPSVPNPGDPGSANGADPPSDPVAPQLWRSETAPSACDGGGAVHADSPEAPAPPDATAEHNCVAGPLQGSRSPDGVTGPGDAPTPPAGLAGHDAAGDPPEAPGGSPKPPDTVTDENRPGTRPTSRRSDDTTSLADPSTDSPETTTGPAGRRRIEKRRAGRTTSPRARRGAAVKLLIRVDLDTFLRGFPTDGETCELVGYGPISVSAVHDLVRNGDPFVATILTKGKELVGVAHLGRKPTAHQESALEWIYPTCAAQGCPCTARLQIDHRIDWAKTHITLLDWLDALCSHHHDLKTRLNWALIDGIGKRPFVPPADPRHPRYNSRAAA